MKKSAWALVAVQLCLVALVVFLPDRLPAALLLIPQLRGKGKPKRRPQPPQPPPQPAGIAQEGEAEAPKAE